MFASVDIGGTITSCAVASGAGQMVAERIIPTLSHEGPEAVLSRIAATINELAASAGRRLAAFGVGVPGLADFHRGRTLFLPNLPTRAWPPSVSFGLAKAVERKPWSSSPWVPASVVGW
jgi:glucokinase